MTIGTHASDYASKDRESMYKRLHALARSVFPDWPDQDLHDFGNILIEMFADVLDTLAFYQDNQALEAHFATATLRSSMLSFARFAGYRVPSGAAATADVAFTLAAPLATPVVIQNGATLRTVDLVNPVDFQLISGTPYITIPAGQTVVVGTVENSSSARDTFTSSGLANQQFLLSAGPFLDGTITVVAADGVYTEVPSLLRSAPGDRHFVTTVDQSGRGRVRFGNGALGSVPSGDITVDYRTGGGSAGNVSANSIRRLDTSVFALDGSQVSLSVTNATRATGGLDVVSNAKIKDAIPAWIGSTDRSVGEGDHEAHVLELPQVARVLFLTADDDVTIPENTGTLIVIPVGGGYPSQELRDLSVYQVTTKYPSTTTFKVFAANPTYKTIDIEVFVYFDASATSRATRATRVREALAAFFAVSNADGTRNTRVDFGANIRDANNDPSPSIAWSDVVNVIRDTPGIRKLDAGAFGVLLNGERADVPIGLREFPELGSVKITDADTGTVY